MRVDKFEAGIEVVMRSNMLRSTCVIYVVSKLISVCDKIRASQISAPKINVGKLFCDRKAVKLALKTISRCIAQIDGTCV